MCCVINNIGSDCPKDIVEGLVCVALLLQRKLKHVNVIVSGILPRGSPPRKEINKINYELQKKLQKYSKIMFLQPDERWMEKNGKLDNNFFYKDLLQFNRAW